MEQLELLVVADPHPTTYAQISERRDGTYLLPICTNFETVGSRTASNRSLQWGEQVVAPIFESRNDYDVLYDLAKRLGFADEMFKNIAVNDGVVVPEDILREINRGLMDQCSRQRSTGTSSHQRSRPLDHRRGHGLMTLGLTRVQATRVLTHRRLPAPSLPMAARQVPLGSVGAAGTGEVRRAPWP